MINVEITAKGNESNNNLIRRFSRAFGRSGIYRRAKSLREHTRVRSKNVERQQALGRLKKEREIERLIKLGKLPDRRVSKISLENEE